MVLQSKITALLKPILAHLRSFSEESICEIEWFHVTKEQGKPELFWGNSKGNSFKKVSLFFDKSWKYHVMNFKGVWYFIRVLNVPIFNQTWKWSAQLNDFISNVLQKETKVGNEFLHSHF